MLILCRSAGPIIDGIAVTETGPGGPDEATEETAPVESGPVQEESGPGEPGDSPTAESAEPTAGSDVPPAAGSDVPPAAEPDYEGPRRRARREREERRAARDRAVAIEHARREAKRKVNGQPSDSPNTVARSTSVRLSDTP